MKPKGKHTRFIDIVPCNKELFKAPDNHDVKFLVDGQQWWVVTLTTKELRRLRRKIGVYLKTMESEYQNL